VAGPEQVDLAMVFGAGFPPYRGGVLRHADTIGLRHVVDRLRSLRAEKGPRFEPCALLVANAEREGSFTGSPAARREVRGEVSPASVGER
jgi:3-hydroxyacyl-CoA dehydrogenase/enoyl-CoA hydratase/3-hydroxybutyryl-CoA epimerase